MDTWGVFHVTFFVGLASTYPTGFRKAPLLKVVFCIKDVSSSVVFRSFNILFIDNVFARLPLFSLVSTCSSLFGV